MNVLIKNIFSILLLSSFICSSQTKKDDAFFVFNMNHKDYILRASGVEIDNIKKPYEIDVFHLYNRSEYEKREQQIKKDKREVKFNGYQFYGRPKELTFRVVYNSKIKTINHCDTHFLNLVNYSWVKMNTWKENNPNILFKDLYFLFKIEKNKYIKYKVERTVIAY